MSQQTPVLYGNRLYSRETYSTNADPQTLNVILSDGIGSVDALNEQVNKVLADLLPIVDNVLLKEADKIFIESATLSDAIVSSLEKAINDAISGSDSSTFSVDKALSDPITFIEAFVTHLTKILADTVSLSDSVAKNVSRNLFDALTGADSVILFTSTKVLQDILLLQDWASVRLSKPNIWSTTPISFSGNVLYGVHLYGKVPYSGIGARTWVAAKPTLKSGGWKSYNELEPHS